ncbi:MAG: thymidylate kinase [Chloroflexi bacterium]|nr:thymidylate kinase [Chloroflexota bacterium]
MWMFQVEGSLPVSCLTMPPRLGWIVGTGVGVATAAGVGLATTVVPEGAVVGVGEAVWGTEVFVVVCDRFTPSTVAYQGYGRGLPLATIHSVNHLATGGLEPNLVVLLDLPPEGGLRRKGEDERQRFEQEPLAFHRRVHQGYLEQAAADPQRWLVVDASLPAERVAEVVWERVGELLGKG